MPARSAAMRVPGGLRAFHLPRAGRPEYMAGSLAASGIGRPLFPPSPIATVVRTSRAVHGDRVEWLRSFGGRAFLGSTYKRSGRPPLDPHQHPPPRPLPLHDVEAVFPLEFTFDYADGAPDAPPQPVVRPTHVGTSLLGLVPLPRGLVTVALQMAMHDDGRGWDLVADVSALFGALCLIRYEGPLRRVEPENENLVAGFHHLVLYDGECNLCNWSVNFVMRNDAAEVFVFAPQQSLAAAEALHRAGHQPPPSTAAGREPPPRGGGDASVLLLAADGQLHQRSAAALRVGLALDWPWPVLAALAMLVPAPVRNAVYDWVGRNRYRWFGRAPSCRVPTAAERRRFLLDK